MRYYLAPMEGITTYVYRRALNRFFGPMDKYFIPFIVPHVKRSFNTREKNDLLPAHNEGMYAVPQILTCNGEGFVRTADAMAGMGYREINLNLGCPSKTVVSKKRGAGFLAWPDELDRFLEYIFRHTDPAVKISVKTRIGIASPAEFPRLMEIYNRYPMEELIIHPRVLQAFYRGEPDREAFGEAFRMSQNPVCYNGDIRTAGDIRQLAGRFPGLEWMMAGRGIIADPFLAERVREEQPVGQLSREEEKSLSSGQLLPEAKEGQRRALTGAQTEKLRAFHRQLTEDYRNEMGGDDNNVLFKMKELWGYMEVLFPGQERLLRKIRKSRRLSEYEIYTEQLWEGSAGNGR